MRSRILVVGRDWALRARLARMLGSAGYGVELAEGAASAQRVNPKSIHLALIAPDVLGQEGDALVGRLRRSVGRVLLFSPPPASRNGGAARSEAIDEDELLGQVAEALHPAQEDASAAESEPVLHFAGYSLDCAAHTLFNRDGGNIALTRSEFTLLTVFAQRPGRVLTRDYLRQVLAGRDAEAFERSVDMLVMRLRRKIEPDPKHPGLILTVPGVGYRFAAAVREGAGTPATEPDAAVARDTPSFAAGRRFVTTLSATLAGSLPNDPEELQGVVKAYRRGAGAIIARYGGVVAQCRQNEILAYFGYPVAQEHIAERAIHAALELVGRIGGRDADLPAGATVCVGVASGLVVADPMGELMGEAPAEAVRLAALARPGHVVASAATQGLAGGLFAWRERAPGAWDVLGPTELSSHSEVLFTQQAAPPIGREVETALLLHAWMQAKAGQGRLVLVSGEPGIGKSRLLAALEEALLADPHRSLRYFCSPLHQDVPLHPVIARWQRDAGFAEGQSAEERLDRLEAMLAPANHAPEDVGHLAALLSVPVGGRYPEPDANPQRRKALTFAALRRHLDALARLQPLLMLFEDAHWADPSTLELLDRLVDGISALPILLVVSHRPEFTPPWVGHSGTSVIALSRLDRPHSAMLAAQVAGPRVLAPALLERIVAQADGVPLFTEELTKAVLDEAAGAAPAGAVPAGAAPTVPASLRALLTARLDRAPEARQVAQVSAAIGREFSDDLLLAVAELSEKAVRRGLDELIRTGLLLARGTPPHASYAFKHALVQDAAYGSLLRAECRALHGRIVAALLERGDTSPDLLAHHATEAGWPDKAASWRLRAAVAALQRGAAVEALVQLDRGLALLPAMLKDNGRRRLELDLRVARTKALMAAEGHASRRLGEEFDRVQALCEALGASAQLVAVLFGRWTHAFVRAEYDLARRYGADLLAIGEDRDDPVCRLLGHYTSGLTALPVGAFGALVQDLRRALDLFDPAWRQNSAMPTGVGDPAVLARLYLAWALLCQGHIAACRTEAAAALTDARRLGQPWTLAQALSISAFFALTLDSPDAGLRWLDELRALANEHCFVFFQAVGTAQRGWCLAALGDAQQGAGLLRAAIAPLQKAGSLIWIPSFLRAEAEALLHAERWEEARGRLDESIALATATGAAWDLAEMDRVRGDLLAATGDAGGAEDAYADAVAGAGTLGAHLFALRAATSLAGLRGERGRPAEGIAALAPLLDRFGEETGAPDLQRARTVLNALRASAFTH